MRYTIFNSSFRRVGDTDKDTYSILRYNQKGEKKTREREREKGRGRERGRKREGEREGGRESDFLGVQGSLMFEGTDFRGLALERLYTHSEWVLEEYIYRSVFRGGRL